MAIDYIHTFLVQPGKGAETPRQMTGTAVQLSGKLFDVLNEIYDNSINECNVDIAFNHAADGRQQNPCRDLIATYVGGPTIVRARHIAERLEAVTTHRSGLGLFFLICGREGREYKLIISRFPADSGIAADETGTSLTVEFIERVFMKNALSYKAVHYQDASLAAGFWTGRAVDKQTNKPDAQISNYWIEEFLDSNLRTTSAHGTRRLAVALRGAARTATDVNIKSEIASAVTLAGSLRGRRLSIQGFEDHFGLSQAARDAISRELKDPAVRQERFQFDPVEFSNQLAYRSLELDSGVLVRAEAADFDRVVKREQMDGSEDRIRVTTEGRLTNESLGKVR